MLSILMGTALLRAQDTAPAGTEPAAGGAHAHAALLGELTFLNSGTVESADRFEMHAVATIYNEEYSYMGQGAEGFVTGGHQSYLYRVNGSRVPAARCCWNRDVQQCTNSSQCHIGGEGCIASGTITKRYGKVSCDPTPASPPPPGYERNAYPVNASLHKHSDLGGFDIVPTVVKMQPSFEQCALYCGGIPACMAWVWNSQTTKCYPKSRSGRPSYSATDFVGCSPSYAPAGANCKGPFKPPPPPPPIAEYWGATPPTGMRSSVPLGTIGQGSIELRADGALRDWRLVFNVRACSANQRPTRRRRLSNERNARACIVNLHGCLPACVFRTTRPHRHRGTTR